jgi:hypothetical protein
MLRLRAGESIEIGQLSTARSTDRSASFTVETWMQRSSVRNRPKAATHCLRLFELAAQRKKARVFTTFALRPHGRSAILYWMAGLPEYCSNRAF